MEAKDTVMVDKQVQLLGQGYEECDHSPGGVSLNEYLLTAQAKISFKAGLKHGIWLFAWWKDGVQYVGTSGRTLEQAYKELGIE